MKKIFMFSALLISGLVFSSLYGQQKFDFVAAGFNQQFTKDTLKALEAAYKLNAYTKISDDEGLAISEGDWFQDLPREERFGVRKDRKNIIELAKEYNALDKVRSIFFNLIQTAYMKVKDPDFYEWVSNFKEEYNNSVDINKQKNRLIEKIEHVNNLLAWKEAVQEMQRDIKEQEAIIDKYEQQHAGVLKVLGCDKSGCHLNKIEL